ncbi:hypothetical protein BC939DRAFT_104659 [Gamsiella multidivaricata]|uniref:uncharacterized protein n=1 Tax=Gamsiella multidivaricata TaxID=101098 RepID=UPI0022212305|nr:uncharacterized protein BC939DRAFT_104659 [Gamsiella multidivaricata]KAI7832470.1 hypothetical protein BC939DRAFT_104659 [Gamsiella multidivaricata]
MSLMKCRGLFYGWVATWILCDSHGMFGFHCSIVKRHFANKTHRLVRSAPRMSRCCSWGPAQLFLKSISNCSSLKARKLMTLNLRLQVPCFNANHNSLFGKPSCDAFKKALVYYSPFDLLSFY